MAEEPVNPLTALVKPHANDLMVAALKGDKLASQVISLYKLHESCTSDPAAPALCEAALKQWLRQ